MSQPVIPPSNGTLNGVSDAARGRAFAISLGIGVGVLVLYGTQVDDSPQAIAVAAAFAAAAIMVGGFVGFLFGVPRTEASTGSGYQANTNLEQVSDWLTKILVGVGLTQISAIKSSGAALFRTMGTALGDDPSNGPFMGGLITYFASLGFLVGWLSTRLFLGRALKEADRRLYDLMLGTVDAAASGQPERAKRLATEAIGALGQTSELARRYEALRSTMPSGAERTNALEDVVSVARSLGRTVEVTADQVKERFATGEEGDRLIALVLTQCHPQSGDLDDVLGAIADSRSGFEQYHSLLALEAMMPGRADQAERARIKNAVTAARATANVANDGDRRTVAERILDELV